MIGQRVELVVILGALVAFAPMAVDMYLPAFPALAAAFGTTDDRVQGTLATFFVGFALGQALYGPVADRFGRKPPLYAGLALFAATSAACALAASIDALVALRFLQALGACSGMVIARAMVRDLFDPRDATRVFSSLMLVTGLAPMLAPLLGGYVLLWFGWRAIFWLLAGVGIVALLAVRFRLPESHAADPSRPLALGRIARDYGRFLGDRRYMGFALSGGIAMAGMFAYITGSPFVFIELHRVPAEAYGWLFGLNAVGLVAGAQVNGRLLKGIDPARTLQIANGVQAVAGLALLLAGSTGWGGLAGIVVPLLVYVASLGFTMPNATALAMAPHGRAAGMASALIGTLQFSLAALAAMIVGAIHDGTAVPMTGTIAACGLGAFLVNRLLTVRR
ncbi:MAG: Bcr/CflA family multidrug efflux MFS transporter [Alphaproteobacteria bacterium]